MHHRQMRNSVTFIAIFMIYNFRKEISARTFTEYSDVKSCGTEANYFTQVGGTSGDYYDVIDRKDQFVALQNHALTIFQDQKPIIQKHFPISAGRLNLDLFNNIVFTFEDHCYIYIPENDEIIRKDSESHAFFTQQGNLAFDDMNTMYAISYGKIFYAKKTAQSFSYFQQLENFTNVTHLADGHRNNFYFAHGSEKTSWIIIFNGFTEQTIMQTSSIKYLNYISSPYGYGSNYIFFIDQNCTMKAFEILSTDIPLVYKNHELWEIMHFEECDYRLGAKFVFPSHVYGSKDFYFINKNKIYHLDQFAQSNPQVCLYAYIKNISINAGVMMSNHEIILATSNGLFASNSKFF